MTRTILRDWKGRVLTVAQPGGQDAQGIYAGSEITPAAAYQIRQKYTGRIYVTDGVNEWLGFPVVKERNEV